MAIGISLVGRDITMTVGGSTLAGVIEKSITLSNEVIETTDDQSAGWAEYLATAGKKSMSLSVSGLFKNLELFSTYFGTIQAVSCVVTYPDGVSTDSTLTFDAIIESIEQGSPSNEGSTYSCSLLSSGAPTFVAGT